MQDTNTRRIAYILNFFPRISETFILNEIRVLKEMGLGIELFSLFQPSAEERNPSVDEQETPVWYVMPSIRPGMLIAAHLGTMLLHPFRYWGTFIYAYRRKSYSNLFALMGGASRVILSGGAKATKADRADFFWHFVFAVPLALRIRRAKCDHVHAHFADAAANFALLCARLNKREFSFTAHAFDIYARDPMALEKVQRARFVVTCTGFNGKYLAESLNGEAGHKVRVIYHGLDVSAFEPAPPREHGDTLTIMSVGRLVPKKGFPYLLSACRKLVDRGVKFRCIIVGDGPLRRELEGRIAHLMLQNKVRLIGYQPHERVKALLAEADLFVLPSVVEESGNRDGIPNVLVEALAMEVPVVSTEVSGIPELVIPGENGLLVPERDEDRLEAAMAELLEDPDARRRMGQAGRKFVQERLDIHETTREIYDLFTAA